MILSMGNSPPAFRPSIQGAAKGNVDAGSQQIAAAMAGISGRTERNPEPTEAEMGKTKAGARIRRSEIRGGTAVRKGEAAGLETGVASSGNSKDRVRS